MNSKSSIVRLVAAASLAVLLFGVAAGPVAAEYVAPIGAESAAAFVNCGTQIIEDLGTVRPSLWSDKYIVNCNEFAAPVSLLIGNGGWRDAGMADVAAYSQPGFVVSSLGGWADAGAAKLLSVSYTGLNIAGVGGWRDAGAALVSHPKLGALQGGAR